MYLDKPKEKNWKGGQLFDSHDFVEIRVKFVGRTPTSHRNGEVHCMCQFPRRAPSIRRVHPEIHVKGCGRGTPICREKSGDSRRKIGLATVREETVESGTKACVVRGAGENAETPDP